MLLIQTHLGLLIKHLSLLLNPLYSVWDTGPVVDPLTLKIKFFYTLKISSPARCLHAFIPTHLPPGSPSFSPLSLNAMRQGGQTAHMALSSSSAVTGLWKPAVAKPFAHQHPHLRTWHLTFLFALMRELNVCFLMKVETLVLLCCVFGVVLFSLCTTSEIVRIQLNRFRVTYGALKNWLLRGFNCQCWLYVL